MTTGGSLVTILFPLPQWFYCASNERVCKTKPHERTLFLLVLSSPLKSDFCNRNQVGRSRSCRFRKNVLANRIVGRLLLNLRPFLFFLKIKRKQHHWTHCECARGITIWKSHLQSYFRVQAYCKYAYILIFLFCNKKIKKCSYKELSIVVLSWNPWFPLSLCPRSLIPASDLSVVLRTWTACDNCII